MKRHCEHSLFVPPTSNILQFISGVIFIHPITLVFHSAILERYFRGLRNINVPGVGGGGRATGLAKACASSPLELVLKRFDLLPTLIENRGNYIVGYDAFSLEVVRSKRPKSDIWRLGDRWDTSSSYFEVGVRWRGFPDWA